MNSHLFKTGILTAALCCTVCPGTWKVVHSFPAPSNWPNGLAWDGAYLWHAHEREPIIYKLDPVSGNVLASIETEVHNQGDIAFHAGQLWVVSEYEHILYHIDHNTGETIGRITFDISQELEPGDRSRSAFEGLTSDGTSLWLDYKGREIYRVDPGSGKRVLRYERDFGGYADGLAWGWGNMFMSTNSTEILEIDACTGLIIEVFKAPAGIQYGPEGMAFDGEYLWYADKTTDRIYQIQLIDDYLVKKTATTAGGMGSCSGDEFGQVGAKAAKPIQKNAFNISANHIEPIFLYRGKTYRTDGGICDITGGHPISNFDTHEKHHR